MTTRSRPLALLLGLLCALAQAADAVPLAESPDAAPAQVTARDGQDADPAVRGSLPASEVLAGASLHGLTVDAERLRAEQARVAEPSTLLLVSCGLFGLIAWSRRRR
jgi:hypothetical protein